MLVIVGIVLLLCCVGGVGGGFWFYNKVDAAVAPARDAASGYLDDLGRGDYPGAYARLCESTRSSTSEADFTRMQSSLPAITDYDITGTTITNNNGRVGGTVVVELTRGTGGEATQILTMAKEDGTWRVCL
ncbi:Rv0361 family membrane protein [Micromonospora echinofusca]|uniref:DUF4878 domain-containing protein n=1 Tax=Micromonospora echinofusca TaxID=47858 RepID=A0ABS3VP23_MICEH|nr:DUF4878 domain-containing protein [Micromonospora echinofusca]MBO4206282.1 DUF4878 domain-containing protein [Micromonospora echinofusca]